MRRIAMYLSLVGMAAATSLGAMSTPALADTSVPAPSCDSSGSLLDCFVTPPPAGVTLTWTIFSSRSFPQEWSVTAGQLLQACHPNWEYNVWYSYTSGGVTYTSLHSAEFCTAGFP